ncbi:hypothetical protein ACLEJQ_15250 [Pseudomonas sp. SMV71]|uniref:hypothetical protein n=1 Tax=Pseudomonas sp. SMV71 TaxID=3390195 RepID=UPI003F8554C3
MNIKIGGATLAVILTGMLVALGVSECQRGPLNPEVADGTSDEQKTWLTIEHRIRRYDPALTEVIRNGPQTLTVRYRPGVPPESDDAWVADLLRIVGHGLAALNNAPGGKQYTHVTVQARRLADDDVELVYDMRGFDAIKTQRDGYTTFASQPRRLTFNAAALTQLKAECRNPNTRGFYPEFCERVRTATARD